MAQNVMLEFRAEGGVAVCYTSEHTKQEHGEDAVIMIQAHSDDDVSPFHCATIYMTAEQARNMIRLLDVLV